LVLTVVTLCEAFLPLNDASLNQVKPLPRFYERSMRKEPLSLSLFNEVIDRSIKCLPHRR
jgi:hypothetical protein